MAGMKAKGSKKNRKVGRNKLTCEAYRREGRREKNKAICMAKHLARHPNDKSNKSRLEQVG